MTGPSTCLICCPPAELERHVRRARFRMQLLIWLPSLRHRLSTSFSFRFSTPFYKLEVGTKLLKICDFLVNTSIIYYQKIVVNSRSKLNSRNNWQITLQFLNFFQVYNCAAGFTLAGVIHPLVSNGVMSLPCNLTADTQWVLPLSWPTCVPVQNSW